MSDHGRRALAFLIGELRPDWTSSGSPDPLRTKGILDALTATTKPLPDLALDAIDAARNPAFKSPRILTTHRAPARPANPRAAQPPRVIDCGRCGQPDGVNHYCSTLRPTPTWHERRRELATHYGNLIAIAKRAHDHDTADLLRQQWSAALAELNTAMATHIGGGQ